MSSIPYNNEPWAPPPESLSQANEIPTAAKHSYSQILKSSTLVGGSSAANIVIGVARAKAMAMLLGPAGVGLAGLYSSIADVTSTVAGMGVNSSGVRQIAAAVGSEDSDQIARTTIVLRRVSMLLGLLGAALLIAFSAQVSALTFGSAKYAAAINLLSIAVFFRLVSAGQGALIQGMRRISDLAKMGVWGALFGTIITIGIVFVLREKGIVPSLICGAAATIFISWRYSRKIRIQASLLTAPDIRQDVGGLLKLGMAFMVTSLMTMGSAYVVRIIILRQVGFEGAGLYQAAWTLGGLYVGFILQAMGADFYPRLTACANDNAACNRLVNEQAFIGLLLGGPGVLATLTLAPLVITIFYTAKFHGAVEILRWLCLGTILQVISWPMGFITLAKGLQNIFLLSDFAWIIVYLGLTWVCIRSFGLNGAGMAFFASYMFHLLMTYPIVRHLSGFRWSSENKKTGLLFFPLIAVVFFGFYVLPFVWALSVGAMAVVVTGIYSIRVLIKLVSLDRLPGLVRFLLSAFGYGTVAAVE
jgi:PST family polysaccharide transporter